jgi:hypothetical protein
MTHGESRQVGQVLLPYAEGAENVLQNIVGRPPPGNFFERAAGRGKLGQHKLLSCTRRQRFFTTRQRLTRVVNQRQMSHIGNRWRIAQFLSIG